MPGQLVREQFGYQHLAYNQVSLEAVLMTALLCPKNLLLAHSNFYLVAGLLLQLNRQML
jgi:hypothetical protein